MTNFVIKRGLDLPVDGAANKPPSNAKTLDAAVVTQVGVNGYDIKGLKPKMLVSEGEKVLKGQAIFSHKDAPDMIFTAPKAGTIAKIVRGKKRFLETVIIDIDEKNAEETFSAALPKKATPLEKIADTDPDAIKSLLLASGLWPAFRTRPFSKVPLPSQKPGSIFVTAVDTAPNAPDPRYAIAQDFPSFTAGLHVLSLLAPKVHLCLDGGDDLDFTQSPPNLSQHHFSGPHPAGLVGTHIHHIDPVSAGYTVWHIGYQDVIAIGHLLLHNELYTDRIIALVGPAALHPRMVKVPLGANIKEIAENEAPSSRKIRVVSGCILNGQRLTTKRAFLSRFHQQISLVFDDPPREFMGWIIPSRTKFSSANVHLSSLLGFKGKKADFSTNLNGSPRAMVPFGLFEEVFPLHDLPTQLLRSLLVLDTDMAQDLGCLELDEEDLALCSYCCLSKYEYGIALRSTLEKIEKEG